MPAAEIRHPVSFEPFELARFGRSCGAREIIKVAVRTVLSQAARCRIARC